MNKEFDAVKLQREIRAVLGEKYRADPQSFIHELSKKYGNLRSESSETVSVGSTDSTD
jgi:hypothetical protein